MSTTTAQWLRSAGILGLMWVAGCADSSPAAPGAAAAPQALAQAEDIWDMVPAEADLVLFADLAKLRQSSWTGETFDKVSSAGDPAMDQLRSMDRVIFAKVPALQDGAAVLVAQGKIDREVVRAGFRSAGEGLRSSTYRGAELLARGDEALAFVGRRSVVSGSMLAVRAAIDCYVGAAPTVESEAWLKHLRHELEKDPGAGPPVASLYVQLQPATREALKQEMGEGEFLEEVGARIDLGADLDASAIGVVRTDGQARDLAARLADRIRDVRPRPIITAFGLAGVLDSLRFSAKDNRVLASLHVSDKDRADISAKMSIVAETLAKLRGEKIGEKAPDHEAKQDKEKP
jgi:hypothetical protein